MSEWEDRKEKENQVKRNRDSEKKKKRQERKGGNGKRKRWKYTRKEKRERTKEKKQNSRYYAFNINLIFFFFWTQQTKFYSSCVSDEQMSIFIQTLVQQTVLTCERGLRPAAAKCICLQLAHVRPYKTAHYSRVMPRTHVAASSSFSFFFFAFLFPSSTLCELPLKAWRRSFLHASFLSSLSSFLRCFPSFSFFLSPFFFFFFFFFSTVVHRRFVFLFSSFFSLSLYFYPRRSTSSPRRPRNVRHVQMRLNVGCTYAFANRYSRCSSSRSFPLTKRSIGRFQKCRGDLEKARSRLVFGI